MKAFKIDTENVGLNGYENLDEAYYSIAYFIFDVYIKRLHSTLWFNSPVKFEKAFKERKLEMFLIQKEKVAA